MANPSTTRLAIRIAGDGATAAIAIDRYLTDGVWREAKTDALAQ